MQKCYEIADTLKNDNDWVYFVEDDYLHDNQFFASRISNFAEFAEKRQLLPDIFIHPTDYPDQYTRLLARNYIFQTPTGYWREVSSTTMTFMCKVRSYKKYSSHFKNCGVDDGKLSNIFKKSALCFSPLPGVATHMHEGVMSGYIRWEDFLK
jgi:hypothetical protein